MTCGCGDSDDGVDDDIDVDNGKMTLLKCTQMCFVLRIPSSLLALCHSSEIFCSHFSRRHNTAGICRDHKEESISRPREWVVSLAQKIDLGVVELNNMETVFHPSLEYMS